MCVIAVFVFNSPSPNPSPLERGVNTLTSCWRTNR